LRVFVVNIRPMHVLMLSISEAGKWRKQFEHDVIQEACVRETTRTGALSSCYIHSLKHCCLSAHFMTKQTLVLFIFPYFLYKIYYKF